MSIKHLHMAINLLNMHMPLNVQLPPPPVSCRIDLMHNDAFAKHSGIVVVMQRFKTSLDIRFIANLSETLKEYSAASVYWP